MSPSTLSLARHGHRLHHVHGMLVALGGYAHATDAPQRGTRQTFAFDLPHGPWLSKADMIYGRPFLGSAVVSGMVYAVGGPIERYDPLKDEWRVVLDEGALPSSHLAVASRDGRLHILGGQPAEASGHFVFDPRTGRLEKSESPPGFERGDHLSVFVTIQEQVHIVGGISGRSFDLLDRHHVFDGRRWSPRTTSPRPLSAKFSAYAVVDATLYVFSARNGLRYDVSEDRWSEVAALPTQLVMPSTVVLDGHVYVIGGLHPKNPRAKVYVYDPMSNAWRTF